MVAPRQSFSSRRLASWRRRNAQALVGILLQLVAQRADRNAENVRGVRPVAQAMRQRLEDEILFDVRNRASNQRARSDLAGFDRSAYIVTPNRCAIRRADRIGADLFGEAGVFKTVTDVLLFLIGALSVVMIIIGGLRYVISGGDSSAVQSAKNTILYAIVGLIVAILAYAAIEFVISSFSGTSGGGTNV